MAKSRQSQRELGDRFDIFGDLKAHIGKRVIVNYVFWGTNTSQRDVLEEVNDYISLKLAHTGIPFIGKDAAIRSVRSTQGKVLYENPVIPEDFYTTDENGQTKLKELSFGQIAVRKFNLAS